MSDSASIIDGKSIADSIASEVSSRTELLIREHELRPGLAVVIVGEDPASQVYVRNKGKKADACGFKSIEHALPAETSESELLTLISSLNNDNSIHGILVQLPLPNHINEGKVLNLIDPRKDVDGFHPINVGLLSTGQIKEALVSCTPAGAVVLAKRSRGDLTGLNAVVVGRSNIVGKPVAQLLLQENCTVTIAHSRTKDLPSVVRNADLVVAAVGRPEIIRGDWIKPGSTVIDVGINRIAAPERGPDKTRIVGDVAFEEAATIAGAITPVPGGVGPMTISMLMFNTLTAARRTKNLPDEPIS